QTFGLAQKPGILRRRLGLIGDCSDLTGKRRKPDPQIRRNLTHGQTARERDPNRIPIELVAVSCCHIRPPRWRVSLSKNRNQTGTGPDQGS
ncbi:MAG: hypothetical protein ACI9ZH_001719, partial [Paracoccaceae bacterium]